MIMHANMEMTSLIFVFEILFLPKYRVNYYDYIIKWCFGIKCNWCVSLDIAHILALRFNHYVVRQEMHNCYLCSIRPLIDKTKI